MPFAHRSIFIAAIVSATALSPLTASAESITGALSKAYQRNSTLNSARAGVRVTDESVAVAKSGYRPTITGISSIDYTSQSGTTLTTGSFGVEIQQSLFDGFQTINNVASAEARVYASNESLRNTEQNILFDAAATYMDVIRDRQIAILTERNLEFLNEQALAARSRLEVGEGTRTDLAQADASRSAAIAQVAVARAQVTVSESIYRQVIGEAPGKLQATSPLAKLLPASLGKAYAVAEGNHPAILATQHLVDAAGFTVKSAEGQLLPQISAQAGISRNYSDTIGALNDGTSDAASIGATLTVPIYQGGRTSAQVRQSKESLGQARIEVDVSRDQVRAAVAAAWSQYRAARETVAATREAVAAAELALAGVIEERDVGQRTTLDVLDSQADLIDAQIAVANAERDVVVASYAILSAIGRLSPRRIGLKVAEYRPQEHYDAVKDKWFGVRTPDGR
ncbi:TolC family outer membrane protein [Allomesorhizobium camelthorni]|uniref:TolC family outer membrane protein n=1 Tax=Allomesorhizobium camelthorni TaxID=475069 RepID=A0A6G4WDL9_9HYPH|nr:TolC family outer membrane protein [Mesorhizobium camelthorni]